MDHIAERITQLECKVDQLKTSNSRLKFGVLGLGALLILGTALGASRMAPSGTGATADNPLYVLPVDQNGNFCTSNGSVNTNTIVTDSRDGNRPYRQ
jgi:hypothetical protein